MFFLHEQTRLKIHTFLGHLENYTTLYCISKPSEPISTLGG